MSYPRGTHKHIINAAIRKMPPHQTHNFIDEIANAKSCVPMQRRNSTRGKTTIYSKMQYDSDESYVSPRRKFEKDRLTEKFEIYRSEVQKRIDRKKRGFARDIKNSMNFLNSDELDPVDTYYCFNTSPSSQSSLIFEVDEHEDCDPDDKCVRPVYYTEDDYKNFGGDDYCDQETLELLNGNLELLNGNLELLNGNLEIYNVSDDDDSGISYSNEQEPDHYNGDSD